MRNKNTETLPEKYQVKCETAEQTNEVYEAITGRNYSFSYWKYVTRKDSKGGPRWGIEQYELKNYPVIEFSKWKELFYMNKKTPISEVLEKEMTVLTQNKTEFLKVTKYWKIGGNARPDLWKETDKIDGARRIYLAKTTSGWDSGWGKDMSNTIKFEDIDFGEETKKTDTYKLLKPIPFAPVKVGETVHQSHFPGWDFSSSEFKEYLDPVVEKEPVEIEIKRLDGKTSSVYISKDRFLIDGDSLDIEEVVEAFNDLTQGSRKVRAMSGYHPEVYAITVGCKKGIKIEDMQKVIKAWNDFHEKV